MKSSIADSTSPMERSFTTNSSPSSRMESLICPSSAWSRSSQLPSFQFTTLWMRTSFKAIWNSRWLHFCSIPWKKVLAQNNRREWQLWTTLQRTLARWLTSLRWLSTELVKLSSPESWLKLFLVPPLWSKLLRHVPNAIIVESYEVRRKQKKLSRMVSSTGNSKIIFPTIQKRSTT